MREKLIELIQKSMILQYKLPCSEREFEKTCISKIDDFCLFNPENEDLISTIYNSIVDYAFNEWEIDVEQINKQQRKAIKNKIRFNENATEETQMKYGFLGEVILNSILLYFFQTKKIIAKGYFFNKTDGRETTGYDSFHIMCNDENNELWFGEVKFYLDYKEAIKKVLNSLSKVLSEDYLNTNLLTIFNQESNMEKLPEDNVIQKLLDKWNDDPEVILSQCFEEYNLKVVYPILILFDDNKVEYDTCIKKVLDYISKKINSFENAINASIFFIFFPISDVEHVKREVIKCISEKRPLL